MNFFEKELKKIIDCGTILNDVTFSGRVCYGDLGGDNRAKLSFMTLGYADNYEALKVEVLNRTQGVVDRIVLRLKDELGNKKTSNRNFSDGIFPHIWKDNKDFEWYVYHPTADDYKILAESVNSYLSVFLDKSLVAEKKQQKESVKDKIRTAKKEPASKKAPSNKQEREL